MELASPKTPKTTTKNISEMFSEGILENFLQKRAPKTAKLRKIEKSKLQKKTVH